MQSTIRNKLEGVTKGFLVYLRIAGIGYRATQQGQTLTFKLGYSHDIVYTLPDSMRAFLPEPTLLGLYGVDKNQVLALMLPRINSPCAINMILHRTVVPSLETTTAMSVCCLLLPVLP